MKLHYGSEMPEQLLMNYQQKVGSMNDLFCKKKFYSIFYIIKLLLLLLYLDIKKIIQIIYKNSKNKKNFCVNMSFSRFFPDSKN